MKSFFSTILVDYPDSFQCSCRSGVQHVSLNHINIKTFTGAPPLIRLLALLALLYVFFVSISLMGASFKFFGGDIAKRLLETTSNPFVGLFIGILATSIVQSSSAVTVLLVGFVDAGLIPFVQAIGVILVANIGTTVTAFLASMATGSPVAVAVAFSHLVFNLFGIAIFWPLKRIPIWCATALAELTVRSRTIPFAYIALTFFIVPGAIVYLTG